MIPMIDPVLYIDPQASEGGCLCPRCGGDCCRCCGCRERGEEP